MKYKNAQENINGSIDCLIHINQEWVPHTQDPAIEYELHEVSEWGDIKPCDPVEKAEAEKAALKEQAVATVQSIVDSEAQARGYDDINSAAKYTGFNNSFRAESEALLVWCASCWDKLIEIQDSAKTVDDVVSAMPKFVL